MNNLSGRTPWDALVEVLSTWKLLFLIFGSGLILFMVVHFSAEPGTTVEFFGIAKYQKSKPEKTIQPTAPDEISWYYMPKNSFLAFGGYNAIPILDGTLALVASGSWEVKLVGSSMGKIKVGARRINGIPDRAIQAGDSAVIVDPDSRLEIEYRGRVFAVNAETDKIRKGLLVSVENIPRATLELAEVKALETGGYGN